MNKVASFLAGLGAAAALAAPAQAVDFVLESHVGDAWTYTLVYGLYDNMSFAENGFHATVTLTGLSGVTAVSGPTSTDFPHPITDANQQAWIGSILDGGSTVVFTMPLEQQSGTGNYPTEKHVYGFTLIAPGAVQGEAMLATNGFYYGHYPNDGVSHALEPVNDRDVAKTVAGPVAVPEPATWAMMILGFAATGAMARRRGGRASRGRRDAVLMCLPVVRQLAGRALVRTADTESTIETND